VIVRGEGERGHRADAEDALAETAHNWTTASGYDAPEAYLHVTVTRKVFRQFRWRLGEEKVAELELSVSPHATPHKAFAARKARSATLTNRLLDAERRLADGFAADAAGRDRVRAAADCVAQPKRRWWRG
jgi:hypothetical protein